MLIASEAEYGKHLRVFPDLPVDDLIEGRVTHLGEMNAPQVRSTIWAKVDAISAEIIERNRQTWGVSARRSPDRRRSR